MCGSNKPRNWLGELFPLSPEITIARPDDKFVSRLNARKVPMGIRREAPRVEEEMLLLAIERFDSLSFSGAEKKSRYQERIRFKWMWSAGSSVPISE